MALPEMLAEVDGLLDAAAADLATGHGHEALQALFDAKDILQELIQAMADLRQLRRMVRDLEAGLGAS